MRVRKIRGPAVWVFALAALIANTAISIYNLNGLLENDERIDHTRKVLAQIYLVLSDVKDAETGQRGYLLTDDANYLKPYDAAMLDVDARLETLKRLVADNSDQQTSLGEMESSIGDKLSEIRFTLRAREEYGSEIARQIVSTDYGRTKMESIRAIAARMVQRENDLLSGRAETARAKFRATMATAMVGGILTLGMTGLAFVLIRRELSRRKIAEAELRRSEKELRFQAQDLARAERQTADTLALFESFLAHAPIGLAFLDPQLRLIRINQHLAEGGGISKDAGVGTSLNEIVQSFPAASADDIRYVLRTREAIVDRLVYDSSLGANHPRTWQTSYYPILSPEEELLGIGLIARDITTRLRNERALRDSQARFRNLAESMPQFVWVARANGYHEYFNQRWYDYTGRGFEASIGFGWTAALHPDDTIRAEQRWAQSIASGEAFEIEYRIRGAAGHDRWFLSRGLPQRDEFGRIVGWFGTATDIHERKEFEDELHRGIERFRLLTEAIPQMVWTSDPCGKIEYYNRRWVDYTGLTANHSDVEAWSVVIHADDRARFLAVWNDSIRRGIGHEIELRLRQRSDGRYRWHVEVAAPMRGENGAIVQWVGTLTDVHDRKCQAESLEQMVSERTQALSEANLALGDEVEERKKAEEKERESAGELRRSNLELEQFAYVASHDLQEPLRKIQAFGDRLQQKFRDLLGDLGRQYLERITASATRMRTLINDLLAFSRVATHPQPFELVDLAEVVRGVLFDLDERIVQTQGTIDLGSLPNIEADPLQMRQLFQNLIANALKFHRPGVPPVVTIRAETIIDSSAGGEATNAQMCRIEIADNGIGFDEKYRERIFQIFQRLHGRNEYEGTGIGLAICRKIVERHTGTLQADSVPGQGSTFEIILPVHQADLGAPARTDE